MPIGVRVVLGFFGSHVVQVDTGDVVALPDSHPFHAEPVEEPGPLVVVALVLVYVPV